MRPEYLVIAGVIGALFGFGCWYDRRVSHWEQMGYHDGYLSLIVALGVGVTICGIAVLDLVLPWNAGLTSLMAFAASGLPMIAGSISRHVATQRRLLRKSAADAITLAREALRALNATEDDHADKA